MEDGDSLASSRSRRQKSDKHGRLAALAKISGLKGGKHKYEVKEETPVFELVSEAEYSKNVQNRQEDDWIVDDGTGYVEDGREIFDDDEEEKPDPKKSSKQSKSFAPPTKKAVSVKGNIKSMFMTHLTQKKSDKVVKLDDDKLLEDIMQDIHSKDDDSSATAYLIKPTLLKKRGSPQDESPKTYRRPSNPFVRRQLPRVLEEPTTSPFTMVKEVDCRKGKRPFEADDSTVNNNTVPKPKSMKSCKTKDPEPAVEEFESHDCSMTDDKISNTKDDDFDMSVEDCSGAFDDVNFNELDSTAEVKTKDEPEVKTDSKTERNFLVNEPGKETFGSFEPLWDDSKSSTPEAVCDAKVDTSHLPMSTNEKGEEVLRMYWLDAYEDYFKHPGVVYLFGKVWIKAAKTHVSCCIIVKNIDRKVFLLKRDKKLDKRGKETDKDVIMNDVYLEFREAVMDKYKINEFKCKTPTKLYAFEKEGVPYKSEYLEVIYSANCPQLPMDLKGDTFSHAFGTNTSSLEQFLIERKLKGPSWLEIKFPNLSNPPISWCKLEAVVNNPNQINVMQSIQLPPPPPLVIMALSFRTCVNPSTHQNEIVAVSCLAHTSFPLDKSAPKQPFQSHFCAITKPSSTIFPFDLKEALLKYKNSKVEKTENERAMLAFLLAKIHKTDPDLIVGHDIVGFDLKLLLHRLSDLKISQWSRLGRLRKTIMPKLGNSGRGFQAEKSATCGRLICDIQVSAKELIRCKSYDLTELVNQVLRQPHQAIPADQIRSMYRTSTSLIELIDCTLLDGSLVLKLMCELNVIPLALQITSIAGNLMSRTLLGGRSERNEFLLLHAFHEKNFICPDKFFGKHTTKHDHYDGEDEGLEVGDRKKEGRRKPTYAGGLVLEPKKGFYDKYILLMDFNSLYPSIIQEYNICFTTVRKPERKKDGEEEAMVELPDNSLPPGVLPIEIRKLVESRRQVKQMMKASDLTSDVKMQYDIRQKALKLTANSMYGCLGFANSRFYAKPLAALVTGKGREVLLNTKDLVQKMGLEVIYGDTDSIMINSNCLDYEQVMKLGGKVKLEVNKLYRQLEIDIDGLYKPMLLLKKKKYAALSISKLPGSDKLVATQEMKGLDIVRRDWSELAKKAGKFVIGEILSAKLKDELVDSVHNHLQELGNNITSGQTNINDFIITKQLTKNPEDYPDKKSLAHVQVAMRVNSKSGKKLKQGDTISYVICQDGSSNSATQRSYHPDELKSDESLKIDTHYYLTQQVLPVVSRLCDPIDGTDTATLAEFLGLDPSSYKQHNRYNNNNDEDDSMLGSKSIFNDATRYDDCDSLHFSCPNADCCKQISVTETFLGEGHNLECSLHSCPDCKADLADHIPQLCNQLTRTIRQYINKYYLSWLECEDPSCLHRTRKLGLRMYKTGPLCSACEKSTLRLEYTETQLYLQLNRFQTILDLENKISKLEVSGKIRKNHFDSFKSTRDLYRHLKQTVDHVQKYNGYGEVVLSKLFQGLLKPGSIMSQGV